MTSHDTEQDATILPMPLRGVIAVPGSPGWLVDTIRGRLLKAANDKRAKKPEAGPFDTPELPEPPTPPTPVLDWLPEVTGVLVTPAEDAGGGEIHAVHYRVRVGEDEQTVSAANLRTGELWDRFPSAVGVGTRQIRDTLHNVVRLLGTAAPRVLATTRTGWHADPERPGRRVYLRGDGSTVPAGRPIHFLNEGDPRLSWLAAPPEGPGPDAEALRSGLARITEHGGWATLVTIGTGARALGQSIRRVPTGLVVTGEAGAGKSSAVAAGRAVGTRYTWEPPSTVRFTDTATDIECRLDTEADMPALLDDLALPRDASAADVASTNRTLDMIIRSLANGERFRGRRNREMGGQRNRYARSPLMVTAENLPPIMMASLYRRSVVLYLVAGDVDTTWWGGLGELGITNGAAHGPILHTLGDRIVHRLAEAHGDRAAAILDQADARGRAALVAEVEQVMPDWESARLGVGGMVRNAGALLGGLVLLAEAADADPAPMLARAAEGLARSLVRQRHVMEDRAAAADDLGNALGDVIRHAMAAGRAHVATQGGKPAVPEADGTGSVPGRTPGELGLHAGFGGEWAGRGLPLYWLPDLGALGIRSETLHTLCAAAGDPRVQGYTVRSLPPAVLRAGASYRSPQAGQSATHRVQITGHKSPTPMILLRREMVWPDLAPGAGGTPAEATGGPSPTPEAPAQGPAEPTPAPAEAAEPAALFGTGAPPAGQTRPAEPTEAAAPAHRAPAAEPAPAPAAEAAPVPIAPAPGPRRSAAPTPAAYALGWDGDTLWTDTGIPIDTPAEVGDHMGRFLDHVAALLPPRGGTVAITAEAAARLGMGSGDWHSPEAGPEHTPTSALGGATRSRLKKATGATKKKAEPAAEVPAPPCYDQAAALHWKGGRSVTAWSSWRATGKGSVSVVILEWMDGHHKRNRIKGAQFLSHTDTPASAAYMLGGYARRMGHPYRLTGGVTGVNSVKSSSRLGDVEWLHNGFGTPAASPMWEKDLVWARPLAEAEAGRALAHQVDARAQYLSTLGMVELATRPLQHLSDMPFKKSAPGYWRIPHREDRYPVTPLGGAPATVAGMTPPPIVTADVQPDEDGMIWVATPTLAEVRANGYLSETTRFDAYLQPMGRGGARLTRTIAERWRDGYLDALASAEDGDPDETRILHAIKATFRETVGMFERGTNFVWRPDWRHTTVSLARTNLLRNVRQTHAYTGEWPVLITTDAVWYTSDEPDPEKAFGAFWFPREKGGPKPGFDRGVGMGSYHHKETMPIGEFSAKVNEHIRILGLGKEV
ncbi:hypothetical protein SAMN05421803_1524 [Nocardiopsis flavescens]|uniref:DUF927 domain-containing protein n=1 Tax=Nocardiopsis flavescens TaxID=758803 RepID=A0A1M6WVE6_9ACTN|nr:hypothetical protein [Nocardiopsis flavescens]SHK97717.1 hypothetical protein SAMN05421803_1524 [Nocardiopsis flavescens]